MPSEQGYWFLGHKMWLHNCNPGRRSLDDPANSICLHPDLLGLLDQHSFVICPSERSTGRQFVAYFIRPGHAYAEGFHRVEAHIPESVSLELIYARFALNVLAGARVSRDVVKTVKPSAQYEAELTALLKARFGRQPEPHCASIRNGQTSQERERLQVEAVRRQLAVEEAFYNRYPHLRECPSECQDARY